MTRSSAVEHLCASPPQSRYDLRLLAPTSAPGLMTSSPHVVALDWLEHAFGFSNRRRALLDAFRAQLADMRRLSILPLCALVGGSFLRDGDEPGDLDALVVYRLAGPAADQDRFAKIIRAAPAGLDLRYVPADAEPELLVKMSCFFHTLYQSTDRGGGQPSLIVALRKDF